MPLAEKALIAGIRRLAENHPARTRPVLSGVEGVSAPHGVITGIGDDCAVLRLLPRQDTLVTTDFTLEGIHFRRDWHSPESVGHRCLARGLSDIAAMGGEPVAAFLSLAVPRKQAQSWVERFLRGLIDLAVTYDVVLAGGDTAESPDGILADIVIVGSAPKGKAILRSGARPGDGIYVTGELGGSAAAVSQMTKHPKRKLNPKHFARHFFPEPRIEAGHFLREKSLATAMIDSSDGLSTDLAHICEESGVGAEIWAEAIPRARVGTPPKEVDLNFALHGGEDYELLFTARRGKRVPNRIAGVPVTRIGQIIRGRGMILKSKDGADCELALQGWEHFAR